MTQAQKERIWKREEEAFKRKHQNIQSVQQKELIAKQKLEGFKRPGKMAEKYGKVESKLLQQTKAQLDKKREKFDPKKDGTGRDALTMGGNVLGVPMRSQPGWRAGI